MLCDRDGYLALPIWEAEILDSQITKTIFTNKYEIDNKTPKLCDTHADELFPEFEEQLSNESTKMKPNHQ